MRQEENQERFEATERTTRDNLQRGSVYRDELNFAEFPLAALTDRLPEDTKTLVFTDTIWDQGNRIPVTRTLTIAASDKYGLPTALDEEVILGLIQLTGEQKFADRKVYFTRYELIKLLGWRDKGETYARIDQSLRRWMGVTLYYEKAWWSREDQSWVTEQFHILEQVSLMDRERRSRRMQQNAPDPHAGKSFFLWNEVVWASFKAGHLKKLDFAFYKALATPISKRMFRFLDKRFWFRDTLTFRLRDFACEHIGLSKAYHTGEIKRRLRPAIQELERLGYLETLPPEHRFVRLARGEWDVVFSRPRTQKKRALQGSLNAPQEALAQELLARGVGERKARHLAASYPPEGIQEKIALHDWLKRRDDRRMAKPTGFLIHSIEGKYDLRGFPDFRREWTGARTRLAGNGTHPVDLSQRTETQVRPGRIAGTHERDTHQEDKAFEAQWQNLSPSEQEAFETEAVAHAEPFLARRYREGKGTGGSLFAAVRDNILAQHWRRKRASLSN